MSIGLAAAGDSLSRTADLLDYNSPFTIMGYAYFTSLADFGAVFHLGTTSNVSYDHDQTGCDNASQSFLEASVASSFNSVVVSALSTATWYRWALIRESTTLLRLRIDGSTTGTITENVAGRSAITRMNIGRRFVGGSTENQFIGRIAAVKAFTVGLNATEEAAEAGFAAPVRTTDIYDWWPLELHTDLRGQANGRDWSSSGTLTTVANPPGVAFPAPPPVFRSNPNQRIVVPTLQHIHSLGLAA